MTDMLQRPDWRGLCEELTEHLALLDEPPHELVCRAQNALSQPEPEVVGPSEAELLKLMPETMRDEFSYAAKVCSDATGGQVKPGIFRICLNTAALEYARAVLARYGRPAPAAAGELAELVVVLCEAAMEASAQGRHEAFAQFHRAADLLEHHPAPVPVALSERPWEREGWCDEQGQCWMGDPGGGGFIPSWRLCRPEDAPRMRVSLPFHALPLPSGEVEA